MRYLSPAMITDILNKRSI